MNNYFLSTSCLVCNFSDKLSIEDNSKVLAIYRSILSDKDFLNKYSIYDVVPTYNSIAFHFDGFDYQGIEKAILEKVGQTDFNQAFESKTHCIEVQYNGMDLEEVSKNIQLSVSEIVKLHTKNTYHIAMLGFKPYFPYLLGMDKKLEAPRLAKPRNRVGVGSIGIGGAQTAIFTTDTPSGWNIIGNTDFRDFSQFRAGDKIIFKEVR
ncbi:allophanate hydrolase subunit 1 [Pseudofrancisella aestuarii]|uniref:Allophanate hydrolase subunit 1 n=1 Tax=Pseudofrancisella aestuarii TaxID=2670347 RepID=A0ABV9TCE5_9GAMM|nr:carboxyltransferase domain-containing protein [Pseudofrancisella aestuarii]